MSIKKSFFAIIITGYFLTACSNNAIKQEPEATINSDVEEKYQWDLSDLYADLKAWEAARLKVASEIQQLSKLQGSLGKNAQSLHRSLINI